MGLEGLLEKLKASIHLGLPLDPELVRYLFVDRKREVEVLLTDLRAAIKSGRGGARLIIGGAGFGKTTLVEYVKLYAYEKLGGVVFSCVELRHLSDVRPEALVAELYRKIVENLEDAEGRRGKELLTHVSETLHRKFSRARDRLELALLGRVSPRVVERFEKIGGLRSTLLALAAMVFDDLNPVAYDYILGVRSLEPDEARALREKIGRRVPWSLSGADTIDSFRAVVRALREAGYSLTVVAVDELEMLAGWRRDWIARVLPKLTAYVEVCSTLPCYMIITTTPDFWKGEKSVESIYPFLYQRLNAGSVVLKELPHRDAVVLVQKIYSLYRSEYGEPALEGVDVKYLAERVVSEVGGHPRSVIQRTIQELESLIVAV